MARRTSLLVIAAAALTIGLLVYLLGREHGAIYFLTLWSPVEHTRINLADGLGGSLPAFVHSYAFILLTYWVVFPDRTGLPAICLGWMALESLFEGAQSEPLAAWLATHTPAWFTGVPLLENWADYFLHGTFDPFDLLAIAAGGIAAYLTAEAITRSA